MESKTLKLQYGHTDGHTSVCFSSEGSHILTCGSDGDVRIWTSQDDGDPVSECVGEMAIALAHYGNHFYMGTDTNYVQAYTFPNAKRDGIVSRFTAPVTHIAISQEGNLIAAGSCDMEVQVTDVDNGNAITKMVGHTAPITGVAVDPAVKYLASSSCDGSVRIWDIKTGNLVRILPDLFPSCNDFFRAVVLGRPSWQGRNGAFLAVPVGKQVSLYDRDTWAATVHLTDPKVFGSFSIVEFSPCGNYLAAASTSGEVIVWDVSNQVTISSYIHPKKASVSCVVWRPDSKALAVSDRMGQFTVIDDVLDNLTQIVPAAPMSPEPVELGDGDSGENEISLEEIKKASGWGSQVEDDGVSSVSQAPSVVEKPVRPSLSCNLQPAFQPSATPIHFQHRFMVWNAIGIVRCFNTEEENSIDVEFHDTMFHHTMHVNNYEDYTMAALSSKTLVLASPAAGDSPSKLTCILLNAWDGSKEWSVSMPEGESIRAVAAAGKWVAAATDSHHLRLFSVAGVQRQPLALIGQVVCLVGHEAQLGVIYHQGIGVPDSQNLAVVVYEVHDMVVTTVSPAQPLPLPPRATLKWAGFTDEGRFCTFDSVGVLRCLGGDMKHWVVLADTNTQSKGPSDHFFLLGVSERFQNIRCVLCKGSFYPMTTPRPTLVEIPLKLPLCEPDAEKSNLEDTFWRLMCCLPSVMTDNQAEAEVCDMEKMLKQTVIKMFANACKGDMELRATEVASLMPEQVLQIAAKYASKCGKMHLADKLNELESVDGLDYRAMALLGYGVPNQTDPAADEKALELGNGAASQRDLFEDSPAENKLLMAESQDSSLRMTPTPTVRNPFKVKDHVAKEPSGLSFFDKPVPQKVARVDTIKNPALLKKVGKSKSPRVNENNAPKKPTFMQWFASHKETLTQEYPDLSVGDLTKKAMSRFREELSRLNSTGDSQDLTDSPQTQSTEGQKRKLEDADFVDIPEKAKKTANEKLNAFSFRLD